MTAKISVVMGSISGWEATKEACQVLEELGMPYEEKVVSTHRVPDLMSKYARGAREKGIKIIIVKAGGAAHLPGMVTAKTTLPVIDVPVQSRTLSDLGSFLSIVQMLGGVLVAITAIGKVGATNTGLLAIRMLPVYDLELEVRLAKRRLMLVKIVIENSD